MTECSVLRCDARLAQRGLRAQDSDLACSFGSFADFREVSASVSGMKLRLATSVAFNTVSGIVAARRERVRIHISDELIKSLARSGSGKLDYHCYDKHLRSDAVHFVTSELVVPCQSCSLGTTVPWQLLRLHLTWSH